MCLIQLADGDGRVTLIDPLALRDLSALRPLMADPRVEKILHSGSGDIALLKRDFGFEFASVFDTEIAARFCGRTQFGLQALLENELAVHHSKGLQRSDWTQRPLSPAHETYLAEDVRHLFALRDRLRAELKTLGREAWAGEECEALARIDPTPAREAADFMSAKGARDLSLRDLAVLRELYGLREEWARRADMPLFKVLGDDALMVLSVRRPANLQALSRMPRLPARLRERHGRELLAAIRRGEAVPDDQLPVWRRSTKTRTTRDTHVRVARLAEWRAGAAKDAALEPGHLLPQRLIDAIAAAAPADLDSLAAVPDIHRWRVAAFGPALLAALRV